MEEGAVYSFIISSKVDDSVPTNLTFISSKVLGADDRGFYLLMYGGQFALYIKYKSTLGIVTSNHIESDLLQFELNYDYYYLLANITQSHAEFVMDIVNVMPDIFESKIKRV